MTLIEESSVLRSLRVLAAMGVLCNGAGAAMAQGADASAGAATASGLIVKLKPAAQEGQLQTASQAQVRVGRLGRLSAAAGYTSVMPWRHLTGQTAVMAVPSGLTPAVQKKLIDRLMATGQVEWVEPNVREPLAAPSNANFNPQQWWLGAWGQGNRGVPGVVSAWNQVINTNGSTSALSRATVVAVLDTGMQTSHPDMPSGQFLPGRDFVSQTSFAGDGDGWDSDATDPGDSVSAVEAGQFDFLKAACGTQPVNSWHGAIVAAFVSANGTVPAMSPELGGARGANPAARILPVRVAGKCGADLADIVAGMYWAAGLTIPAAVQTVQPNPNPAKVLNISFGGADACGNTYQDAVNAVRARGVSVVAAAGNEHTAVARPGNCSGVIAVSALNRAGFKSTYSNFGSQIAVSTLGGDPGPQPSTGYTDAGRWGDFLGDEGLLSMEPTPAAPSPARYAYFAGTSYSAPIVSGVISLMLDVNPNLTPDQVLAGLKVSARPHVTSNYIGACSNQNPGRCLCTTSTCGAGVVDAYEAVRYALATRNNQSYARATVGDVRLDNDGAVASDILSAVRVASQDRGANAVTPSTDSSSSSGGGGGGAMGWLDISALLGLLALGWRFSPRRQ